jgi:hypothetical protein
MSKRVDHIILTVDYEIFGNGMGSLNNCLISPTNRILNIAENYNAPVTLFVEMLEFDSMKREWFNGQSDMALQIASVEQQICNAVMRGHDAQLHLHPQWIGAKHLKNGLWQLDNSRWRIGDLSSSEVKKILVFGKTALEDILNPIMPQYRCKVFRAGAWCIQPSYHIIRCLMELGFKIDSSVAPSLFNRASGDWFDFRAAPNNLGWWHVSNDVCSVATSGLVEVPIAVSRISKTEHFFEFLVKKKIDRFALDCNGYYGGPNDFLQKLISKISKFLKLGLSMLDFSSLNAKILIEIVKKWRADKSSPTSSLPIVAIAHAKNFSSTAAKEFLKFLEWVSKQPDLIFSTYEKWMQSQNILSTKDLK